MPAMFISNLHASYESRVLFGISTETSLPSDLFPVSSVLSHVYKGVRGSAEVLSLGIQGLFNIVGSTICLRYDLQVSQVCSNVH